MIRTVLSMAFVMLLATPVALSSDRDVKVEVSSTTPAVLRGESFTATIHVRNDGTTDLHLADSQYANFYEQWVFDNPRVRFSGGVSIISVGGQVPEILLRPGREHQHTIYLSVPERGAATPVAFRMGFKATPNVAPIWSNPVTIQIKENEVLPIRINASTQHTQAKSWESINVSAHIVNTSNLPQHIGTEVCGVSGVINWVTDSETVFVQGGSQGCRANVFPPREIILQPNETYDQTCLVSFDRMKIAQGLLTFKIGLKNVGHLPAWSNAMTLGMEAGTEEQKAEWRKSDEYRRQFAAEEDVASRPDGIVRRYYETGELCDERTVKNGKLNGPTKCFYKNGTLRKEVIYHNGEPIHWVDYNTDGSVQFDSTPLDGVFRKSE